MPCSRRRKALPTCPARSIKKKLNRTGLIIGTITALVVLCCGGTAIAALTKLRQRRETYSGGDVGEPELIAEFVADPVSYAARGRHHPGSSHDHRAGRTPSGNHHPQTGTGAAPGAGQGTSTTLPMLRRSVMRWWACAAASKGNTASMRGLTVPARHKASSASSSSRSSATRSHR